MIEWFQIPHLICLPGLDPILRSINQTKSEQNSNKPANRFVERRIYPCYGNVDSYDLTALPKV